MNKRASNIFLRWDSHLDNKSGADSDSGNDSDEDYYTPRNPYNRDQVKLQDLLLIQTF